MFGLFNNKGKFKSIQDAYDHANTMEEEQYRHLVALDKGMKGLKANAYADVIYSATKMYRDYSSGFGDVDGHAVEYRDGYTKPQLVEKIRVFNDLIDNANLIIGNYVELIKGDIPQMFSDMRNESQTRIKALERVISEMDEPAKINIDNNVKDDDDIFDWSLEDFKAKNMYHTIEGRETNEKEAEQLYYQTQLVKLGAENPTQMNFVAEIGETFKASTGQGINGMIMIQKAMSEKMNGKTLEQYQSKLPFYEKYNDIMTNLFKLSGEDKNSVFFYDMMATSFIVANTKRLIEELS